MKIPKPAYIEKLGKQKGSRAEDKKGARVFAVIGGISSGLKSRERSCPYAFLAPGSGVRVIGGRKFPRAKQQAATQVNLDVASSH